MAEFTEVLALGSGLEESQLLKDVQNTVRVARTTKATGCLVHCIMEHSGDGLQARKGIQAELKDFRAHVGVKQEEKLLHKLIWSKVQSVLKGSS
eukprot:6490443-Amphidinium_carterae.2